MKRTIGLCVLAAVFLLIASASRAETTSDLLEKGIYTEETVGDLNAAIKIYQKIVADEKAARVLAAKAEYRLAMCLSKQGKTTEARETFEDLAKRFPEQKELVADAKKHFAIELKLEPVCWQDGEVFHIVLKSAGGKTLGNYIYQAVVTEYKDKKVWQLQYWQRLGGLAFTGVSRVHVDYETLRPIHSFVENSVFGCFDADYGPTEVTIRSTARGKESTRTAPVVGQVYDNEEGYWVFRCLPLSVGYRIDLPIFATFGAGQIELPLNVTSKEPVDVAAGKFECHRIDLGMVNQTFWISADKTHSLVKFEAGALSGELAAVNPKDFNRYANKTLGCSIEAPQGWFVVKSAEKEPAELLIDVIDPESTAITTLVVEKLDAAKPGERLTARQLAEQNMPELAGRLKNFKVRSESWTERTIAGRPAVSFLADFVAIGAKRVAYVTLVLGEITSGTVVVQVSPDGLDEAREQIDPVVDTLKLK